MFNFYLLWRFGIWVGTHGKPRGFTWWALGLRLSQNWKKEFKSSSSIIIEVLREYQYLRLHMQIRHMTALQFMQWIMVLLSEPVKRSRQVPQAKRFRIFFYEKKLSKFEFQRAHNDLPGCCCLQFPLKKMFDLLSWRPFSRLVQFFPSSSAYKTRLMEIPAP